MEKIDFNKTLLECIGQSKPEETNNDFIIRCMQAAIEQDRKKCIAETKRINGVE